MNFITDEWGAFSLQPDGNPDLGVASYLTILAVLLVDDGRENRRLLSTLLKRAGATVKVAENGQVGIDMACGSDGPFDIILMDMQMPVMDGYQATKVRRQEKGFQGPILALTASAMTSDREACLEAGCNEYTTRPISWQDHMAPVKRHIQIGSPQAWHPPTGDRRHRRLHSTQRADAIWRNTAPPWHAPRNSIAERFSTGPWKCSGRRGSKQPPSRT